MGVGSTSGVGKNATIAVIATRATPIVGYSARGIVGSRAQGLGRNRRYLGMPDRSEASTS
jgi:hypothetical protein